MKKELHPLFSELEQEIWRNTHVFPTKWQMLSKLQTHFSKLQVILQETLEHHQVKLPENAVNLASRISKGENLDGFPWMVLDYPRHIQGQDIFLFRTLAWFGHGFSCSLIMKGKFCYPIQTSHALNGWYHILEEGIWKNKIADGYVADLPVHSNYEAIRLLKPLPDETPEALVVSIPNSLLDICRALEIRSLNL